MSADFIQQFRDAILRAGLTPPTEINSDGKIHRFAPNGRPGDRAAWYALHLDGFPFGSFGNWRTSEKHTWHAEHGRNWTPAEKAAVEQTRQKREAKERQRQERTRQTAKTLWESAKEASGNHAYLIRKGVKARGLRVDNEGRLIVSVTKNGGELHSLQFIKPDGQKRFLRGSSATGGYHVIGTRKKAVEDNLLCVCEGYATAASIYAATGYTTVAAFSAGNLMSVTQWVHERLPDVRLILCADDDIKTEGNPGLAKATEAARAVSGLLAIPDFGGDRPEGATDFNDLAIHRGLQAVKVAIDNAQPSAANSVNVEARKGCENVTARPESASAETQTNGTASQDDSANEIRPTKYSDDALADLFSARYENDCRYVDQWGWLRWTGEQWQRVPDVVVMGQARQTCRRQSDLCNDDQSFSEKAREGLARALSSAKVVAAVVKLAATDKRHYRNAAEFDRDLWLFNTPGGTVELKTGKLREHRREDLVTKIANATPQGECPKWKTFLNRITGGNADLQSYLQRLAGYALVGDPSEECLDFFYGEGGNGKGTFLKTLQHIFGEYSTTAATETFLEAKGERHPTDIAKLAGARLVVAQEVDDGQHWNESRLKTMTGRDEMTARFMRRDLFDFIPQWTLIISGNNRPSLKTVDEAWRRRFHLVPFDVTIPKDEQNPDLKIELQTEADGILNWCLAGCLEWQRQGLNPPEAVLAATADYFESEDVFEMWLTDCCLRDHDGYEEPTAWLCASHRFWKEQRGEKPLGTKTFSQRLKKHGFKPGKDAETRTGRVFHGIRLTDDERRRVKTMLEAQKRREEGTQGEDYAG